jgi:hypothetical protein
VTLTAGIETKLHDLRWSANAADMPVERGRLDRPAFALL